MTPPMMVEKTSFDITLQKCAKEYRQVLTVVVSDDIGNIDFAV